MLKIQTTKMNLLIVLIAMIVLSVATFTVKNYQQGSAFGNIAVGLAFVLIYVPLLYFLLEKLVNKPIKDCYERVREMVLKGDLTQRIPIKKVNCSEFRKCRHTDCPAFGKKLACFHEVGSNAPGEIQCRCLTIGKFKNCMQCPVAKSLIQNEFNKLAAWINTFVTRTAQSITEEYKGDFNEIKNNLNEMIENLTHFAVNVQAAADQVATGSQEMSSSSEEMSQGATERSSSVEEVSNSIILDIDRLL